MTNIPVKTNMKEVGLRIRSLRIGAKHTVQAAAAQLNVPSSLIERWESGYFHITKNEAEDVAYLYDVPVEWILEGKNENSVIEDFLYEEIENSPSKYIKDESLVKRIGPISKHYRKENFLSRKQLGLLAGVSKSTIERIECMKPVSDHCVLKVAQVVDIYNSQQEIMGINSQVVNTFYSMNEAANKFKEDFERMFGVAQDSISVSIKL